MEKKGILVEISVWEPRLDTWTMASIKQIPNKPITFIKVLEFTVRINPLCPTVTGDGLMGGAYTHTRHPRPGDGASPESGEQMYTIGVGHEHRLSSP